MQDLLQLKEDFTRRGILISFNGPFSHSIIVEIGDATKSYLEDERLGSGTITDMLAVYIEQTQNVRNYIVHRNLRPRSHDSAIVLISNAGGRYTISSGNSILKEDVPELTRRLDEVNGLDREGLRRRYKEELRKKREPGALGAGVGIIDMARRASEKLEYRFDELDADFRFFNLTVTLRGA
jgi:hypothetical protein